MVILNNIQSISMKVLASLVLVSALLDKDHNFIDDGKHAKDESLMLGYANAQFVCSNTCSQIWIGDGICDPGCNNQACNFDGGDCNKGDGGSPTVPAPGSAPSSNPNGSSSAEDKKSDANAPITARPSKFWPFGGWPETQPTPQTTPQTTPSPSRRPTTRQPTTRSPTNPTRSPEENTETVETGAPTFPTRSPTTRSPTTRSPTTRSPTTPSPTPRETAAPVEGTSRPTTRSPTTTSPTTRSPTTRSPTTAEPTLRPTTPSPTVRPTSSSPTRKPTTESPTTIQPTTKSPTTRSPTTRAPTTRSPTPRDTDAPTDATPRPTTRSPTTTSPTTRSPTTKSPTTVQPTAPNGNPTLKPTTRAPTSVIESTKYYNIDIIKLSSMTTAVSDAFEKARLKWQSIVVGNLQSTYLYAKGTLCYDEPITRLTQDYVVDDLLIFANIKAIDGVGKILGSAGPCIATTSGGIFSRVGMMEFDSADMNAMSRDGILDAVILHEMGHVIGIGTLWDYHSVTTGRNPMLYTGAGGREGLADIGGSGRPIIEEDGGEGTAFGHWDDETYKTELFTGYIDGADNPLSAMTVKSLRDLGLKVDESMAEPYTLPSAGRRLGSGTQYKMHRDVIEKPVVLDNLNLFGMNSITGEPLLPPTNLKELLFATNNNILANPVKEETEGGASANSKDNSNEIKDLLFG